jgi:hypothetical protein
MNFSALTTRIAQRVFALLHSGPNQIGAADSALVGSAVLYPAQTGDGVGDIFYIQRSLSAGWGANNSVPIFDSTRPAPCTFRVLDVALYVTATGGGGETVQITQTVPAGGTTNVTDAITANATGVVRMGATAPALTPTATVTVAKGNYMTAVRANGAPATVAGTVLITCMKTA